MKFKHEDGAGFFKPDPDFPAEAATAQILIDVRELLRQQLNELRCIRSLHYSLPDPEDLKAQESKG